MSIPSTCRLSLQQFEANNVKSWVERAATAALKKAQPGTPAFRAAMRDAGQCQVIPLRAHAGVK